MTSLPRTNLLPARRYRGGLTLTEVLIAMGVLVLGLLGVAAIFPVANFYAQKGEIADRGSAVAKAAFGDVRARGMLQPDGWVAWDSQSNRFMNMAQRMRLATTMEMRKPNPPAIAEFAAGMNSQFGSVFVIDPLGMSLGFNNDGSLDAQALDVLAVAPAVNENLAMDYGVAGGAWESFRHKWPVRRVSGRAGVDSNGNPVPLSPAAATRMFVSGDDLALERGEADDPAQQMWNFDSNGNLLGRENRGEFSWIVTVAPGQSGAREALATDPTAYNYDVSVVVFYKRAVRNIATNERLVAGQVVSTGTGGGEILLAPLDDGNSESPFENLRLGQWVMVCGPHPTSTPAEPLFFAQWYRVLAVDEENYRPNQRLVGLRGPDWPWTARSEVRVGLFPGAVAVHTKTMRLEGPSVWSN